MMSKIGPRKSVLRLLPQVKRFRRQSRIQFQVRFLAAVVTHCSLSQSMTRNAKIHWTLIAKLWTRPLKLRVVGGWRHQVIWNLSRIKANLLIRAAFVIRKMWVKQLWEWSCASFWGVGGGTRGVLWGILMTMTRQMTGKTLSVPLKEVSKQIFNSFT